MRFNRRQIFARALSPVLALCAAGLVLFVTLSPAHADTNVILPAPIPEAIAELRLQPALGPKLVPLAPSELALTPALLANYVERQQALRSVDVTLAGPQPDLTPDMLMGYISRASFGSNNALSAIAGATSAAPRPQPSVTAEMLAAYVTSDYQPMDERIKAANAERDCLATAIYHEARGETAEGQLAVANVIVNRARSGQFPDSLCGVIYQNANKGLYRCQFTFACDGKHRATSERRAWAASQDLARDVYAEFAQGKKIGVVPDSTLYYHTTAVAPSWSHTFNRVAVVDSHIFYSPN